MGRNAKRTDEKASRETTRSDHHCSSRPHSFKPAPNIAIEIRDVSFTYPGLDAPALDSVRLNIFEHERLGILGPNGGGKSTLLKLILGLLPMQSGSITIFGQAPRLARDAGLIGYVAQRNDVEIGFPLSVRQVVTLAASWRLQPWQSVPAATRSRITELLSLVGLADLANRPIGALSGGQLQRALIARALASNPKLLVLDEPTVGIDAAGQAQFADLLTTVHRQLGLTLLIVSHDLRAIAAGSDRVACLSRRLHSHTSPQGLTPAVLAELFSHDVAGLMGTAIGGADVNRPATLAGMHIHAHGPDEPCPIGHTETQSVPLGLSAKPRTIAGSGPSNAGHGAPAPGGKR